MHQAQSCKFQTAAWIVCRQEPDNLCCQSLNEQNMCNSTLKEFERHTLHHFTRIWDMLLCILLVHEDLEEYIWNGWGADFIRMAVLSFRRSRPHAMPLLRIQSRFPVFRRSPSSMRSYRRSMRIRSAPTSLKQKASFLGTGGHDMAAASGAGKLLQVWLMEVVSPQLDWHCNSDNAPRTRKSNDCLQIFPQPPRQMGCFLIGLGSWGCRFEYVLHDGPATLPASSHSSLM